MLTAKLGRLNRSGAGVAILAGLTVAVLVAGAVRLLPPPAIIAVLAATLALAAALVALQRRSLARAAELTKLQQAIFASSPNAVVTSDNRGAIVSLNPAAERVFIRSARAPEPVYMSDLIALPGSETSGRMPSGNILQNLGEKMVLEGKRADGTAFPAEIAILRVGTGAGTMFAAYVRDLTEQRAADAARQAQKERIHQTEKLSAMGSLLAGVAHELNNPLAILLTQATLLRDKAPTPDVERRAERIHAAAQRAGRIVKTFLAMARQKAPVKASADVNGMVEAALELVGYGLRSSGIVVERELCPDLPLVDVDRDLVGQVFANTIINAQQALADRPEPRRIRITSAVRDGAVVVDIADNGVGIPEEIRDTIFEPYFTTKPVGAGTGIGLSVCRTVMAAHAGTIEALPSVAEGATFRVTLPAAAPRPSQAGPGALRGLAILIVDDEADVAESLSELLGVLGHRTVVTSSASDALARLHDERFDAVFTDLRMPGMNGLALRRAIGAIDADLARRTVIVTGDTVAGPRADPDAGDGPVLEKPFTAASLRAVLDRIRAP